MLLITNAIQLQFQGGDGSWVVEEDGQALEEELERCLCDSKALLSETVFHRNHKLDALGETDEFDSLFLW
jgi:hypothetical protein